MHPADVCGMEAARGSLQRNQALGAARDAVAARVIVDTARAGDDNAAEFAYEAQQLLGLARVRRARAARLRAAAARAAARGRPKLARMGATAANEEQAEAHRLEGVVIRAVRDAHDPTARFGIGYVTPEEARLLRRKAAEDAMTAGQREAAWARALNDLLQSSVNYSTFGAEGDDDDAEEIGGEAEARIGDAAELFGGDLPAVFGEDCYESFGSIFQVSEDRLRRRLGRKKKRLARVEKKLEELEDAGKSGLRVKFLQLRMNVLEKGIARIEGKLESLEDSSDKMDDAEEETMGLDRAENALLGEAVMDEQDFGSVAFGADDDELGDEGYGDDLEGEEDLLAAVDVYGLAPWRQRMIERRLARLQRRLQRVKRDRARARIQRRIARLEAKLEDGGEPVVKQPVDDYSTTSSPYSSYTTDLDLDSIDPKDYDLLQGDDEDLLGDDEDLLGDDDDLLGDDDDLLGGDCMAGDCGYGADGMGSQVMVGFFERRAAHYGGANIDAFGDDAFAGFWDSMKEFFKKLGGGIAKGTKKAGQGIATAAGKIKDRRASRRSEGRLPRQVLARTAKKAAQRYKARAPQRQARRAKRRAWLKARHEAWKQWRRQRRRQRAAGRKVWRDPARVAAIKAARSDLAQLRRSRRKAYVTAFKAAKHGPVPADPVTERAAVEFREITDGPYKYHQYADGTIKIIDAPTPEPGKRTSKGLTLVEGDEFWDLITSKINELDGAFPGRGQAQVGWSPPRAHRRGPRRPHRTVPHPGRRRMGSASYYCDC